MSTETQAQPSPAPDPANYEQLRTRAVRRLKKRRDFYGHLLVYTLVNSFIVVIWVMTNSGGFFWPVFPIALWGIGLIMNAWDLWHGDDFDERRIQEEVRRIQRLK